MTTATPRLEATTTHDPKPGTQPITPEALWALPRVGSPEPSHDGRHLVVPVSTFPAEGESSTRLWLVEVEGGAARPVTQGGFQSAQPAFSPHGHRIAFTRKAPKSDDGKPRFPQVMVLPLDGGEAESVTDMPLGCFDPKWLPDGSGLVFGAWLYDDHMTPEGSRAELARRPKTQTVHVTERRFYRFWDHWLTDGRVAHLFHLDLETGELTDLTPEFQLSFDALDLAGQFDIAPDGSTVVFSAGDVRDESRGHLRWDVYRVPMAGGAITCLTNKNPASSSRPRFSPDGAGVIYGRTEDPLFYADRPRLIWLDLESGEHTSVLSSWDRSPAEWTFAESGDLYFHAEDDAQRKLYVIPEPELHPDGDEEAVPVAISHGGTTGGVAPLVDGAVVYVRHSLSAPPEIWHAGSRGGDAYRLTWFTDVGLAETAMGEVRDLRFEGADGDPIQMFVVFPPDAEAGEPLPLLHVVHGGPHGIMGDAWAWRWHAHTFAARGIVVAMTNFHGSTSWGETFARSIRGALGDKPYEDTMRGTDALVDLGWVDPKKMAIAGGSYGGYLTSWVVTQTDRFACAINHAGVFDQKLQYASDHTFGMGQSQGALPWDDQAALDRYDPARHTQGLTTPMLILHGERDYRVPVNHALECYGLLKAKGVPARLVYFTDENHWVLKRGNSIRWYGEVGDWLARWLR